MFFRIPLFFSEIKVVIIKLCLFSVETREMIIKLHHRKSERDNVKKRNETKIKLQYVFIKGVQKTLTGCFRNNYRYFMTNLPTCPTFI